MKVVINRCWGGFGLSEKAYEYLGLEWDGYGYLYGTKYDGSNYDKYEDCRANPDLVKCVEELGADANGRLSHLKVVEIPDGIEWYIDDYDGMETIEEVHRTWY